MRLLVSGSWKVVPQLMRCLGPSSFLHKKDTAYEGHVQIVEDLGGERFCCLLSFRQDPVGVRSRQIIQSI